MVEQQIDNGLLQTLRRDIVPRLLNDVPNHPTCEQLDDDELLCRFIMVFDREGYSPGFFKQMWDQHRIACITYRKNCTEPWPLEWFTHVNAVMPRGETVTMQLAEQGSLIGTGDDAVWVKEVRKLTESGHQTAMASLMAGDDKTLSTADARAILQDLFVTPVDLLPTPDGDTREIRVQSASIPAANRRLEALFEHLNETGTIYPGTDLRMVFKCQHPPPPRKAQAVPPDLPRNQEV